MDDFELLKEYSEQGSQPAFRQLVERHVDLVYSAARRQVRSPELAQEVTQSVFVELALHARKLRPDQPLGAWLHVVTRRRAIDALRRESRRQQRELTAVQIAAVDAPSFNWSSIEPLLDEAIASLDPADRNAVVARFLENKSLREVGHAMGASEDAAQKRVSRALDRLREFFGRRGITATATGLAAEISAHAVEAAPVGLVAAIFPAAVAIPVAATSTTTASFVSHLFMTSAQKIIIAAGLAAAVGTVWYEHSIITRQQRQIAAFQDQAESLHNEIHRLSARITQLSSNSGTAQGRSASDQTGNDISPELQKLLSRVGQLKRRLQHDPTQQIPELRYLTDLDWLSQVARNPRLESDDDFRRALGAVRATASQKFIVLAGQALEGYLKVSGGQLPPNVTALASYVDPPLDSSALQRYNMLETGNLSDLPKSAMLIGENPDMSVDPDYDRVLEIGATGIQNATLVGDASMKAKAAFRKAHNGQDPQDPSQLSPYFTNPELAKKYLEGIRQ